MEAAHHHMAMCVEMTALQIVLACKSKAARTRLNYVTIDKSSGTGKTVDVTRGFRDHFDTISLQFSTTEITRMLCNVLDAAICAVVLLALLAVVANRLGRQVSLGLGAVVLLASAADLMFLCTLGTELNVGVLVLTSQSAWQMRNVIFAQLTGAGSKASIGGYTLLAVFTCGSAHMTLAACTRCWCTPRRLAAKWVLAAVCVSLRAALLPLRPLEESAALPLRLGAELVHESLHGISLGHLLRARAASGGLVGLSSVEHRSRLRAVRHGASVRQPVLIPQRPAGNGDGAGDDPAMIVLLVLEATNAAALSPLYAPAPKGVEPTAPFLSDLAARSTTLTGSMHLATMPNTNKATLHPSPPRATTPYTRMDACSSLTGARCDLAVHRRQ